MPQVSVAVSHALDPEEVIARARPVIEKTVKDFEGRDVEVRWQDRSADFSFKSMAFTIKGQLTVDESQVALDVELPFAAMMFKDKVEKAVRKNLTRALEG